MGSYEIGVACALLCGVANAAGSILQKHVVNRTSPGDQASGFMGRLLRNKLWLLGLLLPIGPGTALNMTAQNLIGPALVPGFTSFGLVVLAVASARLLGEKLRWREILGILLLVAGIALLGTTRLEIKASEVNWLDGALLTRFVAFTVLLLLFWGMGLLLSRRLAGEPRGIVLAVSGSFPFCVSNLWMLAVVSTMGLVLGGRALTIHKILFVASSLLLTTVNVAGIRQVQEAYRYARANIVQPTQQVPSQVVPLFIFFWVFQRAGPAFPLVMVGLPVVLILVGGLLLGTRQG